MRLQNPVFGGDLGSVRDPMILLVDEKYYMVATSPPYWEGHSLGVKLWSSEDLLHWKFETFALSADAMPDDAWCKERFWAPELFRLDKKFYLTVSCKNERIGKDFGMFMAEADQITGPYRLVSNEPVVQGGIDAHLFLDTDGQVYFLYSSHDIYMVRFDMNAFRPIENPRRILTCGEEGSWDAIGIEGPALIKRDGRYYLWYSSWTHGYEMGWATTDDLKKPFVKWPQNPLISGMSQRFDRAGHNGVFQLKDGRDAISYHAHKNGEEEKLCIDLVTYPMKSRTPAVEIEV